MHRVQGVATSFLGLTSLTLGFCYLFTQPKAISRNHYEGRTAEPSNKELPVSGEVPYSSTLLHGYQRLAITPPTDPKININNHVHAACELIVAPGQTRRLTP